MPTVNPCPLSPKLQYELADGLPAVGGQLFFYVAGTVNTKQDTYTDSTGTVANTNPLVLNSLGFPTTQIWFQAGLAYKVVYTTPTDTDPPSSPIWTIDNLRGINDTSVSIDQWVASGLTPTFVSGTSFTLAGDQTTAFHPGRRLKTTNSGGTVYSTITNSAFAAVTTVTVVNDASSLDAGLSAVYYGLLTATNESMPQASSTVKGAIEIADQNDMETATSTTTAVTPGEQHFHPLSLKKWFNFTAAAILNAGAGGLDSITDTGVGTWRLIYTSTPFSSANYAPHCTPYAAADLFGLIYNATGGQTATAVQLAVVSSSTNVLTDPDVIMFSAAGDF